MLFSLDELSNDAILPSPPPINSPPNEFPDEVDTESSVNSTEIVLLLFVAAAGSEEVVEIMDNLSSSLLVSEDLFDF